MGWFIDNAIFYNHLCTGAGIENKSSPQPQELLGGRFRGEDSVLFFLAELEQLAADVDDVAALWGDCPALGGGYLGSSERMRFITMLLMWNMVFLSYDIFSTCLLFSSSSPNSRIVRPFSPRRGVMSPREAYISSETDCFGGVGLAGGEACCCWRR